MGRHGYADECDEPWDHIRWRGTVKSAIRGKRGQGMLEELLEALDAMPVKELISGDLITEDGYCCTVGALLLHREVPDAGRYHERNEELADELDVSEPLIQEIEWENDEGALRETPSMRWARMRAWVARQITAKQAQGREVGAS